ncbi:MAG: hypothetical protein ABEI07_01725, partial [Candidatus Nanohaloarchaea archaeon]
GGGVMDDDEWDVFQRDVLDALRQYEGYFDFFERVGSLSDSRPDCFARVSRGDKKEIWIVDAKGKQEVGQEDIDRMEKYVEMVRGNPIDVGLELSELAEHEIRGIFVTRGTGSCEDYEQVSFSRFHQFLQAELVYTDTDRVVRDVAKMMERKQLSQSQARLLFNSIKPFESRLEQGLETLERLETRFTGLELERPPIESYEHDIPVDAVARHSRRDQVFLFDIPYSREAVENVEEKVGEIRSRIEQAEEPVYYTAINTFEPEESEYLLQPGEIESEVRRTAGILPPEEILSLFTPKIPLEREFGDGFLEVRDTAGLGYRARVESEDDVTHRLEVILPDEAASELRDQFLNTREFGELHGNRLREKLDVTKELEVKHSHGEEDWKTFQDLVRSVYQSAVNPVLGRKASSTV